MIEYEKRMAERKDQAVIDMQSARPFVNSTVGAIPNGSVTDHVHSSAHLVPKIYPSLHLEDSPRKEIANSCVKVISNVDKSKSLCSFCSRSFVSLKTHWSKSTCGKLAKMAEQTF